MMMMNVKESKDENTISQNSPGLCCCDVVTLQEQFPGQLSFHVSILVATFLDQFILFYSVRTQRFVPSESSTRLLEVNS